MTGANERGPIADCYYNLQSLDVLEAALATAPLPAGSSASGVRAVLQSIEIVFHNLADLFRRAAVDVDEGRRAQSAVKLTWARGFHALLGELAIVPSRIQTGVETGPSSKLTLRASPAYCDYVEALAAFEQAVLRAVSAGTMSLDAILAQLSMHDADCQLVHRARICCHEGAVLDRYLTHVTVPGRDITYADYIQASAIKEAVFGRTLKGDTYFTQFRALHQVPELLAREVNDRIEAAIREIRSDSYRAADEHLRRCLVLSSVVLAASAPLVDNLATSDYHEIRENLGLTSGSHSVSIRFHMFTHLNEQLCEAIAAAIGTARGGTSRAESLATLLQDIDASRLDNETSWLLHCLVNDALELRTVFRRWRDDHLHMPRNCLGSDHTRSLTGAPDAVRAVTQMRDAAQMRDPALLLLAARQGYEAGSGEPEGLAAYHGRPGSLDNEILKATGRATNTRFPNVQDRTGYFANRSSFSAPPRRVVR